jgi:hypothetical protein
MSDDDDFMQASDDEKYEAKCSIDEPITDALQL